MRRSLTLLVCLISLIGLASRAQTADTETVNAGALPSPHRMEASMAWRAELLTPSTTSTTTAPPTTVAPTTTVPPRRTTTQVSRSYRRPTTTTTAVAPAPVMAPGDCMRHGAKSFGEMQSCWGALVGQYPWPSTATVWRIMYCESKGDPWAHNPSGANGLMQEMGGPYDPAANIARAWSQSRQGTNWSPWTCR